MAPSLSIGKVQTMQLEYFQNVLAKPLPERCREIQHMIQELSIKELHFLFPCLVENIFGFGIQNGWELWKISRNVHRRDFEILHFFLSPEGHEGTLFCLIYKLLEDGLCNYVFPVCCLPARSYHMLEGGAVPLICTNKLQYWSPGTLPTNLLLSILSPVCSLIRFLTR
ncbi:sphingomyelin phosphodiesterase 4-like isoform X2 [Limulus polyphemus]|uniref:Sphingomyelin phosphodiesterase 4-like isoform X2 n=1 Tax=Limulus polyphemus TaxID=6850 RepID=A0ABM1T0R4_LIMPO|nr:sphingomyelin phosphodiesterase 4-like isoform X2 [Limulus polyphemus]